MASVKEALITFLAGNAAVAALCGARISWFGRQRGDSFPALALAVISPGRQWTHGGPDWMDRPRVQLDAWCDDPGHVEPLRAALLAALELGGTALDGSGNRVRFHPAMLDAERTGEEENPDGGARLFRLSLDFMIYHEEV